MEYEYDWNFEDEMKYGPSAGTMADEGLDPNLIWAVENDCYDGEVQTCDMCGRKICREMAKVWNTEFLVVCKDC